MQEYQITFEDRVGQIITEVIVADSLKEAKEICKEYYGVKRFL